MRQGFGRIGIVFSLIGACLALLTVSPDAMAQGNDVSINDLTRLRGLGVDEVWGFGIVMGLPGSGDSPDLLPKARSLAVLMEHGGMPAASLEELMAGRSIAIVMVTARLPEGSMVTGDLVDAHVQAVYDAKSIRGGRLIASSLMSALPGHTETIAIASGLLESDGSDVSTVARVSRGARLIQDIDKDVVAGGQLVLQVRENYARGGFKAATLIADLINQDRQGLRADGAPPIAVAKNDRSVIVTIPEEEMGNPVRFIASLQKIRFDQSLLDLDPAITIDQRAGVISITGNVLITPSVITSGNLVVTVLEPPIPATPANPEIRQSNSTLFGTSNNPNAQAGAQLLLEAMRRLEVPVQDQIFIFRTLEQNNALSVPINWVAS